MARPKHEHPTPAELEVLKIIWERGPSTVRDVLDSLSPERSRAYTSVMSLLNVMADKGLLMREPHGRAFVYNARADREKTLGRLVRDLLGRAFEGSASLLVGHVLAQGQPTRRELEEIRHTLDQYRKAEGGPQ
jgi:predicted transcriptional regulator